MKIMGNSTANESVLHRLHKKWLLIDALSDLLFEYDRTKTEIKNIEKAKQLLIKSL